MKKKLLITGATGFIGKNLLDFFSRANSYDITAIYHRRPPIELPKVKWIQADLRDPKAVASVIRGFDIVIQAAATTSGSKDIVETPHIHVTDNAVMNSYIFRAAHDNDIAHVVFFSCTIMLQNSPEPQVEEQFDISGDIHSNYYGAAWTKLYLEKMAQFYANLKRTRYTVIRHTNVYGPNDKFDLVKGHVCAATIVKVLSANSGEIEVWGNGKECRDLLYIDDLTNFVDLVLKHKSKSFTLYNCGSGILVSVDHLVREIIRISGKSLKIKYLSDAPSIATNICVDTRKAKRELGWESEVDLAEGISRTIEWYRSRYFHSESLNH